MSDRVEGCTSPFGSSEYIKFVPACMAGTGLTGCVQRETCEVWSAYGRDNVESAQAGFEDVLVLNPGLLEIRKSRPDLYKTAIHKILDLAIDETMSTID